MYEPRRRQRQQQNQQQQRKRKHQQCCQHQQCCRQQQMQQQNCHRMLIKDYCNSGNNPTLLPKIYLFIIIMMKRNCQRNTRQQRQRRQYRQSLANNLHMPSLIPYVIKVSNCKFIIANASNNDTNTTTVNDNITGSSVYDIIIPTLKISQVLKRISRSLTREYHKYHRHQEHLQQQQQQQKQYRYDCQQLQFRDLKDEQRHIFRLLQEQQQLRRQKKQLQLQQQQLLLRCQQKEDNQHKKNYSHE